MPMTFTGPAVALRDIAHSLGGSPLGLAWVTNAFMLGFGSFLMLAGALADRLGRRRVLLAGIAGFALASLVLIAAPNLFVFNLLRAAQGVASAAVVAGGAAVLAQAFEGAARLRAFSLLGTSFGAGLTLGPVAAGWLTQAFGWRAIFLLVTASAAIAWAVAAPVMHESRDPQATRLDVGGAVTFTLALALLTLGLLQAPASGWRSPMTIAALLAAAAMLFWFVRIEKRAARPMLDLSLFRYPRFVGVQLLAAAPAYGYVVLLVLLPVRFVGIEGAPAAQVGFWMVALSAPLLVLPSVAALLARRFSAASVCGVGLLLSAVGLVWLGMAANGRAALGPMLMIGVGMGLPWGLMDGLAVSVVPKERAGMAAGIFNTTRVAGEGLALAIVGAVLSALIADRLVRGGAVSADHAAVIAQGLVAGDMQGAAAGWHALAPTAMASAYQQAFGTLMRLLAGVTVATAVMVFAFLGRGPVHTGSAAPADTGP